MRLSVRTFFLVLAVALPLLFAAPATLSAATPPKTMEEAFWARNWRAMDDLQAAFESKSRDLLPAKLSVKEQSFRLNGLWLQGRYAEGLVALESIQQELPEALRPYGKMLGVLGMERTDKKQEAYEAGKPLWEEAPEPLKYYLAYAMGRLGRDLGKKDESLEWFRKMLVLAPDKKRRVQALNQMIALPGITSAEAATLLIDSPSNARALAACNAVKKGADARVEYAVGYNHYINKRYDAAMERFNLASADVTYGEAAKYYHAYAAFREKKNDTAYRLWSGIVLTGNEYPQRSVSRLITLSSRGHKQDILATFKKAAVQRTDYPELAADALVGIVSIGDASSAADAEKKLFTQHKATNQAATIRWNRGWKAWKAGEFDKAREQWAAGFVPGIPNRELAARLLYWQARALQKSNSPEAYARVKRQLTDGYPAEYHTFLLSKDGGISADLKIPAAYQEKSMLEEWGFVTYARVEAAYDTAGTTDKTDIPTLFRAVRLASWEGDYSSAVRAFATLQRHLPPSELASGQLLKYYFPRAFEPEVRAAVKKTGLGSEVIWGIMRQESLYEPDVTSVAGAYGLMQLMPGTAKSETAKMKMAAEAWRQPAGNIMLGANHMVGLLARYGEHKDKMPLSLGAYNAGGGNVNKWIKDGIGDIAAWIEDIPFRETRGYVKAVLRNIETYKLLYPAPPEAAGTPGSTN